MTTGAPVPERGSPAPPPALLDALGERCRVLAASAVGRVFQVPDNGVEAAVLAECEHGARYDTILSFMRTPAVADLDGFVTAIERILADEGWILMVEPSGTGGGLLQDWLPARFRGQSAHRDRSGRDVVSALRAGGFMVTDLHRRQVQSVPARWRRCVELRARRESPRDPQP